MQSVIVLRNLRISTRALICASALSLSTAVVASAQTPRYHTEFLGETGSGGSVVDLNNVGGVVGTKFVTGNQRAFVVAHGLPLTELPLPVGRISSWATAINDQGVISGAVGSFYSPEFAGKAAVWTPNGSGGYAVQELGALPGHTASNATALNNVGDIVGWSYDGTYRYAARFFPTGAPVSLHSTGVFDPQSINDARVLVDRSADGKQLDLNTMTVTSLGVPTGFPSNYTAVMSTHINALGQVGAIAFLPTSTSCVQQAARYTTGIGWEMFGTCGISGGVGDLNDVGEMSMVWTATSLVQLNAYGPVTIESLLSAPVGQWFFPIYSIYRINNAHQLAGWAYNTTTHQTGVVLLTPDGDAGTPICSGDALDTTHTATCPCGNFGAPGNGCAHSANVSGANLRASGTAQADTLVLAASAAPATAFTMFVQHAAPGDTVFHDGVLCAGGALVRLRGRAAVAGAATFPDSAFANDATLTLSQRGGVFPGQGVQRYYAAWYRNAASTFCPPATANATNGLRVDW